MSGMADEDELMRGWGGGGDRGGLSAGSARAQLAHLVGEAAIDRRPPFTIEVVADDRTIEVDGSPVHFTGGRVTGQPAWLGWADFDNGRTVIVHVAGDAIVEAIARCTRTDLPSTDPRPRG